MAPRYQGREPGELPLYDEPEPQLDLRRIIEPVRKRSKLCLAAVAACLLAAFLLYLVSPRRYRATTVIQVEQRTGSVLSVEGLFGATPDWYSAQSFYPTQQKLLESRGLAERVVRDLKLQDDPVFNPDRQALVEALSPLKKGEAVTAAQDAAMVGMLAGKLQAGLSVKLVPDTRLFEISYVSTSPQLASRVANGIADSFINWGVASRQETVDQARSFLDSQTEALKQEIADKEAKLQAYSRRTDIINLDPSSNDTLQRLEELNRSYAEALADRISKESRYRELNSPGGTVLKSLSGGLLGELRIEQLKLEGEYARKLHTFKPEWPAMQELAARIEKGKKDIAEVEQKVLGEVRSRAETDYKAAKRREESLLAEFTRLKQDALNLNAASVEYNNLKVEVSTRRTLLDELTRKQSQTQVAGQLQETKASNVKVVDRALLPRAPYRPSLFRNMMLGLLLGCFLAGGGAFLLEYLDRSIKDVEDVERVLDLPVLGKIWDMPPAGTGPGSPFDWMGRVSGQSGGTTAKAGAPVELVCRDRPLSPLTEAYRSLRTSLFMSRAERIRSILVTSAISGEGKSTTATNLAVVLAQLPARVLLIDGDLRRSRLHRLFRVSNRVGVVSVLIGMKELREAIQATDVDGLSLLPAGPTCPNPAELLSSPKLTDLLDAVRSRFDYLVIDSPPVLPVTDAVLVAKQVDGVLMCVGANIVKRDDARAALERLGLVGCKLAGVVLNRVDTRAGRYDSHYYRDVDEAVAAEEQEVQTAS